MDEVFGGLQQSVHDVVWELLIPWEHDGVVCASSSDVHEKQTGGKGTLHLGCE